MSVQNEKDVWDKVKSLSGLVASVLIPIVLGFIGHWSTEAIKSEEISVRYTELAINVLNQKSTEKNIPLREWATDLLNLHSGVVLKQETKDYLMDNQLLETYVNKEWVPSFSESFAESITRDEKWQGLVNGKLDVTEQKELIQSMFHDYYQIIMEKKLLLKSPGTKEN